MNSTAHILGKKIVLVKPQEIEKGQILNIGNMINPMPPINPIIYTLDNSGGLVTTYYIIGDPTQIIKNKIAETPGEDYLSTNPDSINGNSSLVTANKNLFYSSTILTHSLQFNVSGGTNSFDLIPKIHAVNNTGTLTTRSMPLTPAMKNTQYNSNLLSIEAQFKIGALNCIRIPVAAGETMTVTINPLAYNIP